VRRWWVVIALLLSVGLNAGVLATLAAHRWGVKKAQRPPAEGQAPVQAQAPQALPQLPLPSGQEGAPQRVSRLADQLGLEGEQRRRFISLQGTFFADTVRLRTEQAEIQRELRRALAARQPDQQHIESLLQESGRTFAALERAMAQNVVSTRKLLNPEQERKFLNIVARLRPGRRNGAGIGAGKAAGQGQGQGQQRRQRRRDLLDAPGQDSFSAASGEPDAEDSPPGTDPRLQPQGSRNRADALPFRPRRLTQEERWNRRFGGGLGNRPAGRGRGRLEGQAPLDDQPASPPP
jgi:hypothetical protein